MRRLLTLSTLALALAAPCLAAPSSRTPAGEETAAQAAASDLADPIIMDEKWELSISDLDLLKSEPEGYKKIEAGAVDAPRIIGLPVYDANKDPVGEIEKLVVTPQGKIVAAILGVGGTLGIGERTVAVRYDSLMLTENIEDGTMRIYVNATEDQLKSLPAWEP